MNDLRHSPHHSLDVDLDAGFPMTEHTLDIAEPFFKVTLVRECSAYTIVDSAVVLNLSESALRIREQNLGHLQSVIARKTLLKQVAFAVVVERLVDPDDDESLFIKLRQSWPTAHEVRGEERLRGVSHYMSRKAWVGQFGFTLYHSGSVPLNVGLHREHPFCPVPGFREVHTQLVGFGKMQQFHQQDPDTLYLEEAMAPGQTHRPMYDAAGNFPWHQYETITPSVFMAVEMLPDGVSPP